MRGSIFWLADLSIEQVVRDFHQQKWLVSPIFQGFNECRAYLWVIINHLRVIGLLPSLPVRPFRDPNKAPFLIAVQS